MGELNEYLKSVGFDNTDYVISLQGPTVIITVTGIPKVTEAVRAKITELNFKIIGDLR